MGRSMEVTPRGRSHSLEFYSWWSSLKAAVGGTLWGGGRDKMPQRPPQLVRAAFCITLEEWTVATGRFSFPSSAPPLPFWKAGISMRKRKSITQCEVGPKRGLKPHVQPLRGQLTGGTGLSSDLPTLHLRNQATYPAMWSD